MREKAMNRYSMTWWIAVFIFLLAIITIYYVAPAIDKLSESFPNDKTISGLWITVVIRVSVTVLLAAISYMIIKYFVNIGKVHSIRKNYPQDFEGRG